MTQATLTLDGFNPDHDEQAVFTIGLPEYQAHAGTITLDFSQPIHKITLDMSHPYMTNLAQSLMLARAMKILDTHFDQDCEEPTNEWAGDLYE